MRGKRELQEENIEEERHAPKKAKKCKCNTSHIRTLLSNGTKFCPDCGRPLTREAKQLREQQRNDPKVEPAVCGAKEAEDAFFDAPLEEENIVDDAPSDADEPTIEDEISRKRSIIDSIHGKNILSVEH